MLGYLMAALVAIHIAAALRHHLILRDQVLARMLPGRRRRG
ncbi:cytochrome b/b6 domain-containing protein [Stenotrophomonas maltophilia]|nr:cytochrome b/b6 domain-containing protein [Stenotrophomonas maltophilia]